MAISKKDIIMDIDFIISEIDDEIDRVNIELDDEGPFNNDPETKKYLAEQLSYHISRQERFKKARRDLLGLYGLTEEDIKF